MATGAHKGAGGIFRLRAMELQNLMEQRLTE